MSQDTKNPEAAFENDDKSIAGENPFSLFSEWFELASQEELNDANAMALATSGSDGLPNVRMVLLKSFDEQGFVFYSNTESQKGNELSENMQAAAVLHWKSLRRQIRFRGQVTQVSDSEADEYFHSRPWASRVGAWASQQSRPIENRGALKKAVAIETARFAVGKIPRPPYWTGFRVVPSYIEFWMDKPFRLHDRLVFQRSTPDAPWSTQRLFP